MYAQMYMFMCRYMFLFMFMFMYLCVSVCIYVCLSLYLDLSFKTSPCVPSIRPHAFTMWAYCWHTRRRSECGHVFSACHTPHHTPYTPHTAHHTHACVSFWYFGVCLPACVYFCVCFCVRGRRVVWVVCVSVLFCVCVFLFRYIVL